MKLSILILNDTDKLEHLLTEFAQKGIKGATILDSTGMGRMLSKCSEEGCIPFLGSLSFILNPDRDKNKTILIVLEDEQVKILIDIVDDILNGLKEADSGILFTMPIDYVQGLKGM